MGKPPNYLRAPKQIYPNNGWITIPGVLLHTATGTSCDAIWYLEHGVLKRQPDVQLPASIVELLVARGSKSFIPHNMVYVDKHLSKLSCNDQDGTIQYLLDYKRAAAGVSVQSISTDKAFSIVQNCLRLEDDFCSDSKYSLPMSQNTAAFYAPGIYLDADTENEKLNSFPAKHLYAEPMLGPSFISPFTCLTNFQQRHIMKSLSMQGFKKPSRHNIYIDGNSDAAQSLAEYTIASMLDDIDSSFWMSPGEKLTNGNSVGVARDTPLLVSAEFAAFYAKLRNTVALPVNFHIDPEPDELLPDSTTSYSDYQVLQNYREKWRYWMNAKVINLAAFEPIKDFDDALQLYGMAKAGAFASLPGAEITDAIKALYPEHLCAWKNGLAQAYTAVQILEMPIFSVVSQVANSCRITDAVMALRLAIEEAAKASEAANENLSDLPRRQLELLNAFEKIIVSVEDYRAAIANNENKPIINELLPIQHELLTQIREVTNLHLKHHNWCNDRVAAEARFLLSHHSSYPPKINIHATSLDCE